MTRSTQSLLTAADVAEWLKVSEETVRRWARKQQLASFQLGGAVRFAEDDVMSFLKNRWIERKEPTL